VKNKKKSHTGMYMLSELTSGLCGTFLQIMNLYLGSPVLNEDYSHLGCDAVLLGE
jgi:hypothetical protein